MVTNASNGEFSSQEAQKLLTVLGFDAAEQPPDSEERLPMPAIIRQVIDTATNRRDVGVQEVAHMNLQIPMVMNNVEFVRATQRVLESATRSDGGGAKAGAGTAGGVCTTHG